MYILNEYNDNNEKWVLLHKTSIPVDAELIKATLESAEIPVQILSQADSSLNFTFGSLAVIKIFVPTSFYEEAKYLIEGERMESND